MKIMLADINKYVNVMGGREKVFCSMANALVALGYEVSCLYMDDIDGKPYFPLDGSVKCYNLIHLNIPGVEVIAMPKFPWYKKIIREVLRPFSSNMAKELKENYIGYAIRENLQKVLAHESPDVIISYVPLTTKFLMVDGLCKAPIITMMHDEPSDSLKIATRQVKKCVNQCAAMQVALEYAEVIVRQHLDKVPIVVIGNVVPQYENCVKYENKRKYTIVNIARLNKRQKRQHMLLEAFALLKDRYPEWQVELWGPDNDRKYVNELNKIIERYNMQNRVKLYGPTNNVKSILLKSDIFAFPSRFEAFGLSLAEAMSSGLPAVGISDCKAVKSMLENGQLGLLSDDTAKNFSEKLSALMDDADLRKHYGTVAREAMKRYSAGSVWQAWDKLIKDVICKNNNRS